MNIKDVTTKNGEAFTVCIDDNGAEITVSRGGDVLGTILLNYIECDWPANVFFKLRTSGTLRFDFASGGSRPTTRLVRPYYE